MSQERRDAEIEREIEIEIEREEAAIDAGEKRFADQHGGVWTPPKLAKDDKKLTKD